jgi:RNA polymerase sigma-70 factor, ECF subfamily
VSVGRSVTASTALNDVQLAVDGDELAFARLVDAHHAVLARVAYAIIGDAGMTEDAVQSAWIKAWRKLPTVRDADRIRNWLLAICVNEARQVVRGRRGPIVELDLETPAHERSDPASSVGSLDMRRALRGLSSDDRALLALRYVAGLNAGEIGDLTGRSASGTRVRLSRLTAHLREELTR